MDLGDGGALASLAIPSDSYNESPVFCRNQMTALHEKRGRDQDRGKGKWQQDLQVKVDPDDSRGIKGQSGDLC